jgi:hypothetical protein
VDSSPWWTGELTSQEIATRPQVAPSQAYLLLSFILAAVALINDLSGSLISANAKSVVTAIKNMIFRVKKFDCVI